MEIQFIRCKIDWSFTIALTDRYSIGEILNSGDLGELSPEFHQIYEPIIVPVTAPSFDVNGTHYNIDTIHWIESLGKDLCIADVDTRDFNHDGQILSQNFSWTVTDTLSAGMLNHYLYGERSINVHRLN